MKFRTIIKISTNYMLNIKILEKIQFCRFFTCGVKKWAIVLTRVNFIFYGFSSNSVVRISLNLVEIRQIIWFNRRNAWNVVESLVFEICENTDMGYSIESHLIIDRLRPILTKLV